MKKALWLAVAVFFVLGFASVHAESRPIVIKAITAFPKNHLNNDPVPMLIQKINERSKGRLKIEWLGGPEVIKTFDQIHALKAGTIDMLLYYPFGYMKPVMPEAWAKGLTLLAEWEERKTGLYDVWCDIFAKRVNAKYLGRLHSLVPFSVFTNKKITKVEDFKGLKMRVMPLYIPALKALGATPVTIPPDRDLYRHGARRGGWFHVAQRGDDQLGSAGSDQVPAKAGRFRHGTGYHDELEEMERDSQGPAGDDHGRDAGHGIYRHHAHHHD